MSQRPELRMRLLFGLTMAAVVLGLLAWDLHGGGHWGVLLLGLAVAVFGAREFRRLAQVQAGHARLAPVIAVCVALVLEAHLHAPWWPGAHQLTADHPGVLQQPLVAIILGLGMAWLAVAQMARYATEDFFANLGAGLFGMVYLGIACNLMTRLALLDGDPARLGGVAWNRGGMLLILLIVAVKAGDIAAYFGGRAFGRHKMSPRISPGKTWEGFAASFVGAIGGSALIAWLLGALCGVPPFAGWWQPLVWGLVLGPLGVVGDLTESAMKRDASVKDSGRMLPGFGGWLDVFDALIIAAPVGFLLAWLL